MNSDNPHNYVVGICYNFIMVLILHIIIALTSVAYTTYLLFRPSDKKLNISYTLVALTILSGTYLVFLHPSIMAHACTSGLLYCAVVLAMIAAARRKLVSQTSSIE